MKRRYITPGCTFHAIEIEGEILKSISITTPKMKDDATAIKDLATNIQVQEPADKGGGTIWGEKPWDF